MKTFVIDINPKLENIEMTVKNGALFTRCVLKGKYKTFNVTTNSFDLKRIKQFAVKFGNDNNSNKGHWYAHCNGFAMDLMVNYKGDITINTYRPYGKTNIY